MRYTVLRDTREQDGWHFTNSVSCAGTLDVKLPTGDYTIRGFEHVLAIERKGKSGEFARNIIEKRFDNEMKRLEVFTHPFIILEFSAEHILSFPVNSGIPPKEWPKLRVNPWFFLKRVIELQLQYKTKIIFAGTKGKEIAASIFKRVIETYGNSPLTETAKRRTRKTINKA